MNQFLIQTYLMKHIATIFVLTWLLTFSLQAQDPSLAFAVESVDTVMVPTDEFERTIFFNLVNTTSDSIVVSATRFANEIQDGQASYFCWDLCYDSTGDASLSPITIQAGDTTRFEQYLVMKPNGVAGFASVHMIFANTSTGFAVQRIYEFQVGDATTSIQVLTPEDAYLSQPFPNPTAGHTRMRYRLPVRVSAAQLEVVDMLGRTVQALPLTEVAGEVSIDLSQAQSGLYFLRLVADQQPLLTRKVNLN